MYFSRYAQTPDKPRLIFCGTGQYCGVAARIALDVGYEIVGAYNRAGPKIGIFLGELIGLDLKLGVIVEDIALADLAKTRADIAICTQSNNLKNDLPTYVRVMDAGIDVLTLAMEGYFPVGSDPETAAVIDSCARRNGVTFSGSGIHDMSRIWSGIIAVGQNTHVDAIYHESRTDAAQQGLPEQLLRDYGYGLSVPDYLDRGFQKHRLWPVYTVTLQHVLTAIGYTVTDMHTDVEPIVWETDLDSAYLGCVIPAGRVLGLRTLGRVETKEGVVAQVKTEGRMCRAGEEDFTMWKVDGRPGIEMYIKRGDPTYTNAANLINRVKDVIAGPPGITPVSQFGPIMGPELVQTWRRS